MTTAVVVVEVGAAVDVAAVNIVVNVSGDVTVVKIASVVDVITRNIKVDVAFVVVVDVVMMNV